MSPDEIEDAKRLARKRDAKRARRVELRVRLERLWRMTPTSFLRVFIAPFGIKLEMARIAFHVTWLTIVLQLAIAYAPKIEKDPVIELHAKFSHPCGNDVPYEKLDKETYDTVMQRFRELTATIRLLPKMDWSKDAKDQYQYVYSLEKIASLLSLMSKFAWISQNERMIILKKFSQMNFDARTDK